ncbi:phytoene/squalene synthase family protein [Nocardia arthritidis]|uniref:phytoene/squalene synthase family protein n=1 Tax=Nocardia arthritidis TaxID=228602 RepID=UPI0007A546E4|nr:phytoene/squalene synthase family protein [Nocardia arthritidis]
MTRTAPETGISEPPLHRSYRYCRQLNARHGKTFFLATRLLAPDQRPAVHALYGFARRADDILDEFDPRREPAERARQLDALAGHFHDRDAGADAVLPAILDTADRYRIPAALFDAFLASMRMDLMVTDYPDRAALDTYIYGSAEVIGLQLLPVLGAICAEEAAPHAAALGKAFQLTNFLRDIAEDLVRGRVYLPADELAAFGVDRDLLGWCLKHRRTEPRVRGALAAQHAITRDIYRFAHAGIALLHPRSRPCVTTATTLYAEILDRIEDSDFAVFDRRATVPNRRRAQVGATGLVKAWWARRVQR